MINDLRYYIDNGLDTDLYYKQFKKDFDCLEIGKTYYQRAYSKQGHTYIVLFIHDNIATCYSKTSGYDLFYVSGAMAGWCYNEPRHNYRLSTIV